MSATKHKDLFGRSINVGDVFTMAYRDGNTASAGVGIVTALRQCGGITAWVAKARWNWAGPVINSRPSLLGALDRLVLIHPDTLPPAFLEKLKNKLA